MCIHMINVHKMSSYIRAVGLHAGVCQPPNAFQSSCFISGAVCSVAVGCMKCKLDITNSRCLTMEATGNMT